MPHARPRLRTRLFRPAALTLALAVAGCVTPGTRLALMGGDGTGPALPPAALPGYGVGDSFAYDDGQVETVRTVDGDRLRWSVGPRYAFASHRNFLLPRTSWNWTDDEGHTRRGTAETDAPGDTLWPLEVGRTADFVTRHTWAREDTGTDGSYSQWWQCAVPGTETVAVPAGTFDTFRIVCHRYHRQQWVQTSTWFYAPEVGHFVRRVHRYPYASSRRSDLVAYGPAPTALPDEQRAVVIRTVQSALEERPSGQSARGRGAGVRIAVTPVRTYRLSEGRFCREYRQEVTARGRTSVQSGAACRGDDGVWRTPKS